VSLPELLSKEVSVKRALMALGTGFLLIAVLGSGIGYTWFWNQFDDQPYLQQQVIKYTNILEEQPGNYVVLTELGWALYQLGELDKAIACFQKVLEINPDYISARYNLSLAYKGKKNYELARRELKTIVDKYPRHELAWLSLGEVLMELKKYGDAVEALDRTIVLVPPMPPLII